MINEHENIIIGVYWDDVGISGWKLWGWLGDTDDINTSDRSLSLIKLIKTWCQQIHKKIAKVHLFGKLSW